MERNKSRILVGLVTTSTFSSRFSVAVGAWFTVEVPDADKAKTITVQTWSYLQDDWVDVATLADTTNAFKALSSDQIALVGPLDTFRLKFSAAPAADTNAIIHLSS